MALGVLAAWTGALIAMRLGNYWYPLYFEVYLWAGLWMAVPLALRRLAPVTGFWLTVVVYPIGYAVLSDGGHLQADLHAMPLLIAAFIATRGAALHPVLVAAIALPATLVLQVGAWGMRAIIEGRGLGPDLSRAALLVVLVAAATALGAVFHRLAETSRSLEDRNAELRALQQVRAEAAVRAERTRIARELHDVVAHHVTAIVVRAQAADRVGESRPEEYREAVRWIAPAGREALTAMRSVVRVLREPEPGDEDAPATAPLTPLPDLTELTGVLERVRGAGLSVTADLPSPPPPCPPDVGLAVVRVAQEALTNVLQHSAAGHADVRLSAATGVLTLRVADAGPALHAPGTSDGGNGIGHMRERAAACGGTLVAGPEQDGRWVVRMEVPLS